MSISQDLASHRHWSDVPPSSQYTNEALGALSDSMYNHVDATDTTNMLRAKYIRHVSDKISDTKCTHLCVDGMYGIDNTCT
jgi:hypothetical protein